MPITRTPYFSPTSIGGCALWLDGADTSTSSMTFSSGSNLSVWKDKSGSANDFSLTSGTPSSITDGGYSVVSIPSGAIMTSANQITFTTSSAFFIVSKLLTINPVSANINMLLAFNNISPYGNVGDFSIRFYQGVLQGSSTSGNPGNLGDVGNGNYYVNGTFNPNFDTTYYMNSYSIIDTIAPIQGGTSYIAISSSFYGRPFIGNVAEVIYYSGGVSASQRLQIEGYLAQKWGIQNQLPQGHIGRGAIIYRGVKIGTTTAPLYTQFSPTSIPGCGLWLDGADSSQITKSGSYITSIKEKVSGSVFTATGTTLTTSTINGVQSLNFPGTTYLSGAYTNPASAYLFIVFTVTSITNNAYSPFFNWKGPNDGTANIVGFGLTSGATVAPYQSDQGQQTPTYTVSLGSTYMMCFSFNGTATSLGINGQTPTSGTQPTPISAGSKTSAWICSDYNATTTVNIGELIVYNTSSLTTTQRQQIESYLAQKWGLTATLPSFSGPTAIAGCVLWLDGNDTSTMTFNGSAITQWNDKSASGNYVSQATTSNAPTLGTSQNGLNTVYFATNNQQLVSSQNSATSGNASRTVILLFWCPTTSSAFYTVTGTEAGSTPPTAWGHCKNANADVDYPFLYSSSGTDTYAFVYSTPNPLLTYAQFDSASSTMTNYYSTSGSGADNTIGNSTVKTSVTLNTTAGVWYIGKRQQNGTGSVTSHLLEMIQYNRVLTTTERQQVEGYLAAKWGIQAQFASSHPYYPGGLINHINNTQPAGLPANLTLATVQRGTSYVSYISQILYYSVAPINWTNVWQPYLQQLVAANSGATASISTYSVSGSTASYPRGYGAIAPNGFLYFIGGSGVFVVNPSTNTATIIGSIDTTQYSGLVLGTNGNLYGIPYGSGTVLLITPSSSSPYGTVTTIGSGLDSYQGGCLGPNGTIYALPWVGSNLLTINGNTVTQIAISPRTTTRGSVLGPDGNIYGAPWGTSLILKINPATNTSSTIACNGNTYWGASLAPNGLIYFSPFDPGSFLCLNVVGNIVTNVGSSGTYYCGEVLGPNDKLYLCPYNGSILEYNTATNSTATYSIPLVLNGTSMILAPNGNIYVGGTTSTNGYYISFSGLKQFPSINYCLSAYTNKF